MKDNRELYILPFDHRSSFYSKIFGFSLPLSKKEAKLVKSYKMIVFKGFLEVYKKYDKKDLLGILVDEEFGSDILKKCKKKGINFSVSTEKSGQKVFVFEYGNDFKEHLKKVNPTFAKVLVRYNPANKKDNLVQVKRLKSLSNFCKKENIELILELLVPATEKDLKKFKGDVKKYDVNMRPKLAVEAIKEINKKGVEVDVWKLEPTEKKVDWKNIIKAVKIGELNKNAKIIVLGRGENKKKVGQWLGLAAEFKEIIGFAVGRTVFFEALLKYKNKKLTKSQAIKKIAGNYERLIKLWEKRRK